MQKHVNLVDLVKSFPTNIFLQNLASIQKRRSPLKFAHFAEKSENGSTSNLSTKVSSPVAPSSLAGALRCGGGFIIAQAATQRAHQRKLQPARKGRSRRALHNSLYSSYIFVDTAAPSYDASCSPLPQIGFPVISPERCAG